jgi:hypothetical protein
MKSDAHTADIFVEATMAADSERVERLHETDRFTGGGDPHDRRGRDGSPQ